MNDPDRRRFLARAGRYAGAAFAAPSLRGLVALTGRSSSDEDAISPLRAGPDDGYGELRPAGAELALPRGFTYAVLGREGSEMSDGRPTPRAHDGMAAFPLRNGNVRLVRNHEDRSAPGETPQRGDPALAYDPAGGGGTTSLEVRVSDDGSVELVRDFVSLSGTIVNCAGGPTPWNTWLSCEETTEGPSHGWEREHGYVFEVDADSEEQVEARPLEAMGRFVHEAVAVDPGTGMLYLTEDRDRSGFYRFLPAEPDDLSRGGDLQMLAVRGEPRLSTRSGIEIGSRFPVEWVDIPEPDPEEAERNDLAVFGQGRERGAAQFARLEGCWWGDGGVYFHATEGGDAGKGQVWRYAPGEDSSGGELVLVFESPGTELLDSPDNITVSPRGGIVICEDGSGGNYLRGLTPDGRIFDLGQNILNDREFAGATFGPRGRVLFVNIQGDLAPDGPGNPGMTLAVTGPWEEGAL